MIRCPNCGGDIEDDSVFCDLCGVKLSMVARPQPLPDDVEPQIPAPPSKVEKSSPPEATIEEPKDRNVPPKGVKRSVFLAVCATLIVIIVIMGVVLSGVLNSPTSGSNNDNNGQNNGTDNSSSNNSDNNIPDWFTDYLNQTSGNNTNSTDNSGSTGTSVNEPSVTLGWQQGSEPPGISTTPEEYYHWSFAQSQTIVLTDTVKNPADSAKIANYILFPGLTPSEVAVTINVNSGPPLVTNLFDDGKGGCYGLFVDSMANIEGEKAWTWEYSTTQVSHSVSVNIMFYKLGYQNFKVVAFDQDTGKKVSSADLSVPAHVWGRELVTSNTGVGTWDGNIYNPDATGVVVNYTLHDEMSDLARSHYSGTIKDVIYFEGVSVKVWGIINGVPVLWNPTSDGRYEFYWDDLNGASSHEFKIQVEYLTPLPTVYGQAIMHYAVFDTSSGENVLGYFGESHSDIWVYLQWPTSNG